LTGAARAGSNRIPPSNRQLWRLNAAGYLRLAEEPDPDAEITAAAAAVIVARIFEAAKEEESDG
jgi:hypothetical protein